MPVFSATLCAGDDDSGSTRSKASPRRWAFIPCQAPNDGKEKPLTALQPEPAHDASISLFESIMCPGCRFVLTVTWALDGIQNEIGSERPLSTFGGCHGVDVGCWLRARDWGRPGGRAREVTGGTRSITLDLTSVMLLGQYDTWSVSRPNMPPFRACEHASSAVLHGSPETLITGNGHTCPKCEPARAGFRLVFSCRSGEDRLLADSGGKLGVVHE